MKTKFTNEEMYQVYSNEVVDYMTNNLKVSPNEAINIIKKENFKTKFQKNMENFEFIEPSKIAKQMVRNNPKIAGIRLIKVNTDQGEVLVIAKTRNRSRRYKERMGKVVSTASIRKGNSRSSLITNHVKKSNYGTQN